MGHGLIRAVGRDDAAGVTAALNAGDNVNKATGVRRRCLSLHREACAPSRAWRWHALSLRALQFGWSALFCAALLNKPKAMAVLLSRGATLDSLYDQESPLHSASAKGYVECVRLLLKHGASTTLRYVRVCVLTQGALVASLMRRLAAGTGRQDGV